MYFDSQSGDEFLLEFSGNVAFHKRGLAGATVADELSSPEAIFTQISNGAIGHFASVIDPIPRDETKFSYGSVWL